MGRRPVPVSIHWVANALPDGYHSGAGGVVTVVDDTAVSQSPVARRRKAYMRFVRIMLLLSITFTLSSMGLFGATAPVTNTFAAGWILFAVLGVVALILDHGGVIWNGE